MNGKSAGQQAYEAARAFDWVAYPSPWDRLSAEYRGKWEQIGAAVETKQIREVRADRDAVRKRGLDLAAALENEAEADEEAAGDHRDATSRLLLEERAEAKRQSAARIRKGLDV